RVRGLPKRATGVDDRLASVARAWGKPIWGLETAEQAMVLDELSLEEQTRFLVSVLDHRDGNVPFEFLSCDPSLYAEGDESYVLRALRTDDVVGKRVASLI